jgi:hypothetical protein
MDDYYHQSIKRVFGIVKLMVYKMFLKLSYLKAQILLLATVTAIYNCFPQSDRLEKMPDNT